MVRLSIWGELLSVVDRSSNRRVSENARHVRTASPEKSTEEGTETPERNDRASRVRTAAAKGVALLMKTHACDVTVKVSAIATTVTVTVVVAVAVGVSRCRSWAGKDF